MMPFLLCAVLAVLVAGSQWVTNPEDMAKGFGRAQKRVAGGGGQDHWLAAARAVRGAIAASSRASCRRAWYRSQRACRSSQ